MNEDIGCIGFLPGRKHHPGQSSRPVNVFSRRTKSNDVVHYADDMYEEIYFPNTNEERLASLFSTFRPTNIDDSGNQPGYRESRRLGSLHKVHSIICKGPAKVNFGNKSSNLSNIVIHNVGNDSDTKTPRNKDSAAHFHDLDDQKNLNRSKNKQMMNTTKTSTLPSALLDPGDSEEIDNMVQTEIQKLYTFESLRPNNTNNTVEKVFSTNPNAKTRDVGLNDQVTEEKVVIKKESHDVSDEDLKVKEIPIKRISHVKNNQHYEDGFHIYLFMKERPVLKDRIKTGKDKVHPQRLYENEVQVGVPSDDDDSYKSERHTATILGEENRHIPETVVIVTGHVQGQKIRELPREPLGRQIRTFYDAGDDVIILKDNVPPKSKQKLKRRVKMFCTHCGTHLVSNFHFCGNCGTEVMNTQQTSSSVEQVKEKQVPNGLNEKRKDAKSLSQMTLSLAAQRSLQKLKKKEESTTVEIACQIIDKSGKSLKKVIPGPGGMTGKLFITVPSQSTGDVWLKALRQQYNIQDHVDMQLMEWKDSIGLMKIKPMDTSIPQLKKERTQRKMKCLLTHVQFTSRNRNQIISLFANEKGKTDKVEVVENLESCSKPLKRMHKMVDSDEELEDPAEASKTSLPIHIDLDSSDPSDEEMTKQPKKSRKKNLFVVHKTNAVSFAGASRLQKTIATSLHGPSGLQKQVVGNKDTTKTIATSVPGPSGLQKTNATCTGIPGPSGLQKKKVVGKKDNTNTIATPSPGPSGIQNTVVEEIDSIALPKISYSSRCQEIVSSLTEQIKELRKKKQDRHLVAKDFVPSFPKPGEGVEVIIYDPDSGSQYIRQFDRLTSIKGIYNWIVAEVVPDEIPAQFQFVCLEGCQRDNCNHKFPLDPKTKDDILVENLPEVLCISKQDDQGNRTITCYDEVYFSYFDNI